MTRRAPLLAGLLGCVLVATPAVAASKDECVDANTQAQSLRRDGKLAAAREKLRVCVDATCPSLVRNDCSQRLDELERAQPTIVFEAKDGAGRDLVAVKVTVDGKLLTEHLYGSALDVDPREHVFVFEVAGQPPVTQTFVLHEGEKGRRERIVIGPAPAVVAPPPPPAPASAPPPPPASVQPAPVDSTSSPSTGHGQRIAGIVVGAVGLVGVGLGAVFGASASSSASSARSECASATSCADHAAAVADHDSAASAATISTIGFAAGGALLAGGIVLYLTAPRAPASASGSALSLTPTVGSGSGGMLLRGTF